VNGKGYLVLLQGIGGGSRNAGSNSGRKCSSHQSDKEHEKGARALTHRTLDQPFHYISRKLLGSGHNDRDYGTLPSTYAH